MNACTTSESAEAGAGVPQRETSSVMLSSPALIEEEIGQTVVATPDDDDNATATRNLQLDLRTVA